MLLQTEYNEVVVLQKGGDSSVHNSWWEKWLVQENLRKK